MEIKPGYKQTEVGVIPQEWELKPFGRLFTFANGVNADKKAYGTGFRFINVLEPITYSHIRGPEIQGLVSIPGSVATNYVVKRGDVLFNRTSETDSELGLAATYLGTENVVFGGFVIRGRPADDSFDPTYSGYALRAPAIRSQIIPMGQGAVRANIGQQSLRLVLAPVPPLPEQRAIATALSDVDALLGGLDRLIAKKRDLKQAAMEQLLTGQTRLPGFYGKWGSVRLATLCAFITKGSTPTTYGFKWESSGVLFLRSECVADTGLDLTQSMFISKEAHTALQRSQVQPGDLLITITGNVGRVVMFEGADEANLNQHIARIRISSPSADPRFVFHWLSQPSSRRYFSGITTGQAYPQIGLQQVREAEIPLPSIAEQRSIAAALSDMDAELSELKLRRDKTRALKQAMMQELLTGRTRLI